jgi:hypothetical protein
LVAGSGAKGWEVALTFTGVCNGVVLSDQVVHETVDGETVVINLASGNYYSIAGSGADLWSRLVAGEAPEESAAALAAVHGGDGARIASAILTFHRQLFDQGLLTVRPAEAPQAEGDLGSWEVPRVEVFEDLRAHLLADPVHDVRRGSGWPVISQDQ